MRPLRELRQLILCKIRTEKPSVGRSARRRASFFDGQRAICKLFKKSTKICHDCPVYCSHSPGGNTETSPQSLRFPPRNMPESAFSCGCGCRRSAQQVLTKKLFPVPCHGNCQRRRTDYQHPPDGLQLFRGFHTAGSTAFLLLSTVLPAFCFLQNLYDHKFYWIILPVSGARYRCCTVR